MHRSLTTLLSLSLLLICGSAGAANLLTNGTFSTDVSGWAVDSSAASVWNSADANGAPGSGSAQVTNTSAGASNGAGITRCAGSVTALANYSFGGKVLFPTGQGNTGSLKLGIRWLDSANCTGATVGSQPRLTDSTPGGSWVSLDSGTVQAPAGAVSVLFLAFPSKVEAGGSLVGQFDDLYVDDGTATYTVTYNGNGSTGGSVPADGNTYVSGATVTVLANTGSLVRTGYAFDGWNTAANGSGASYAATGSVTFAMSPANVTLYAQWKPVVPTLSQWTLLMLASLLGIVGALRLRALAG